MSRRFLARTTVVRCLSIGAVVAAAAVPAWLAGQERRAPPASAAPAQVVRLRPGADSARRAPVDARTRTARPLTVAEKVGLVMPAKLGNQPEQPILLNASTTIVPGRAMMSLKNANLVSESGWGALPSSRRLGARDQGQARRSEGPSPRLPCPGRQPFNDGASVVKRAVHLDHPGKPSHACHMGHRPRDCRLGTPSVSRRPSSRSPTVRSRPSSEVSAIGARRQAAQAPVAARPLILATRSSGATP